MAKCGADRLAGRMQPPSTTLSIIFTLETPYYTTTYSKMMMMMDRWTHMQGGTRLVCVCLRLCARMCVRTWARVWRRIGVHASTRRFCYCRQRVKVDRAVIFRPSMPDGASIFGPKLPEI